MTPTENKPELPAAKVREAIAKALYGTPHAELFTEGQDAVADVLTAIAPHWPKQPATPPMPPSLTMKTPTFKGWRRLRGNDYPRRGDRYASVPWLYHSPKQMAVATSHSTRPAKQHHDSFGAFTFYRRSKKRSTK